MMGRGRQDRANRAMGTVRPARTSGANRVLEAPIARASSALLLAFLGLVIAIVVWALWATTDRVATAQGQTVPDRRVQRIQTPERGTVERLLVEEGDRVDAGAELVHVDRVELEAEAARVRAELLDTRGKILRLRALADRLDRVGQGGHPYEPNGLGSPTLAAAPSRWQLVPKETVRRRHEQLLRSAWQSYLGNLATLRQELAEYRGRIAETRTKLEGRRALMPFMEDQRERLQRMANLDLAATVDLEETERNYVEQRTETRALQAALSREQAAVATARQTLAEGHVSKVSEVAGELAAAEARSTALSHELRKVQARIDRRTVTTPVGGTVTDLRVHGPGEVVEPGKPMMKIVPEDSPVEVHAFVSNQDIGRVTRGDSVDVKFQAFDFTRYGSMPGEIAHVSRDATEHDDLGHVYSILVRLEGDSMQVDGERVPLIPGMDVTVDVDLGDRQVIEYFLSPLLRYQDEALREP